MKITDITVTLFAWKDVPEVVYGPNVKVGGGDSTMGLLEIKTDAGVTGEAFLGSAYYSAERDARLILDNFKPVMLGKDPLEREKFYHILWGKARGASVRAIGAVDIALWDLAGKAAGMPIHALIGTYRHSLPAYASSPAYFDNQIYIDEAQKYRDLGFPAYKIHGPTPWREDIKACEAVRKAMGDDYVLMLDVVTAYNYTEALRVGRAIEEMDFYWFEDPLNEYSIPAYVKLHEKLDIPLMATELPFAGFDMYAPWIMAQATDYLRGDVCFKGGITTMLKTAHLAEAFHMNYEVHHGSNSLNNIANLHVCAAIKNCEYFEVLLPDETNKYGLLEDVTADRNGHVHVPMKPGLGVQIDYELIKRHYQGVLS